MQTKSIPRDSLLKRCRDAMTNYGMSLTQFRTYMPCFTRVYNFMERKGIPTYTESVGEEFCLHIKEETSLTGSTKKLNYRAIRLLNHIMTGLPYTLKFGRTPKENAVDYHFKKILEDAEVIDIYNGKLPRIHDLRHTACVHAMHKILCIGTLQNVSRSTLMTIW